MQAPNLLEKMPTGTRHITGAAKRAGGSARHRATLVAAIVLAALSTSCAAARANDFHVFSCEDPYTGQAAPVDDWRYDLVTNGYGDGAGSSCAAGGGAISAFLSGGVTHGFGEGAAATFIVPDGVTADAMTIAAFRIWRYEAVGPVEPFAAPATNIAYNPGNYSAEGLCAQSLGCMSRGTVKNRLSGQNVVSASGLTGVTEIQASAICGGAPGTPYVCPTSNAENGNSAEVDIYAADIVLNDSTMPTVGNVGGPLVSGGVLSGSPTVSFDAADSGPGVYSGTIWVDGQVAAQKILDTNGGACQSLGVTHDGLRSFNHPQPCKSQVSATMALDTSKLAAGTHNVLITVDDASGNTATVWDGTITTTDPHIPNGTPACSQARMSLTINSKARNRITVGYGRRVVIRGSLQCGAVPVSYATIATSGAGHGTITTDPAGRFTYLAPSGPNRTIDFGYRAYFNDTTAAASARARILVRPRIRIRILPHNTRNYGTILWRGRISGGPYPASGVSLLVEVYEGHRWQPFDEIVSTNGRFAYRYTFLRTTSPTSYRFRVALPASGSLGYEYLPGASNTITIHVS